MNATYSFDVTAADFEERVINASSDTLVVVDFWAEWCNPCRMLGPLLEKIVASYGGRVLLAKVNADVERDLAMVFRIQSIPAVKFVSGGQIVDEFMGVQPEQAIRARIERFVGKEDDDPVSLGEQAVAEARYQDARAHFGEALDTEPDDSRAIIGLARTELLDGNEDRARELLSGISELDERYEEARSVMGMMDFYTVCATTGGLDAANARAAGSPDDLDARYALGCCQAADNKYEDALTTFLEIVKRDRDHADGKAREAMVTLFKVLGSGDALTTRYRDLLARELF